MYKCVSQLGNLGVMKLTAAFPIVKKTKFGHHVVPNANAKPGSNFAK